jgi:dTMP kinase
MDRQKKNLFIVFEGIDGSGKTTQAKLLEQELLKSGYKVLLTAEPSFGPIGLKIRSLEFRPSPEEELRLFIEDRKDHVTHVIDPAIKKGIYVITDRYVYSSVAYQGARGINPAHILDLNSFASRPDITFYIDVPVDIAMKRILHIRNLAATVFETRENLIKVNAIYDSISDATFVRVDGCKKPDEIHKSILETLLRRFHLHPFHE